MQAITQNTAVAAAPVPISDPTGDQMLLLVQNVGPDDIHIGGPAVTTADLFISAGAYLPVELPANGELYALSAGASDVRVLGYRR